MAPDPVTPERVLTIRRVHLDRILGGHKSVEFRAQRFPADYTAPVIVALHMALKASGDGFCRGSRCHPHSTAEMDAGKILAVAKVYQCDDAACLRCGEARANHARAGDDLSRWPFGWHVSEVRRVVPVAWRGNVGLPRYTGAPLEVVRVGCYGYHRGPGSPECPRQMHHHHDEGCEPGLTGVVLKEREPRA